MTTEIKERVVAAKEPSKPQTVIDIFDRIKAAGEMRRKRPSSVCVMSSIAFTHLELATNFL